MGFAFLFARLVGYAPWTHKLSQRMCEINVFGWTALGQTHLQTKTSIMINYSILPLIVVKQILIVVVSYHSYSLIRPEFSQEFIVLHANKYMC